MANYKSFHHVLKVDKPDVEGVLHGTLEVFPKIDGSNGEMFAKDGKVCYGSRKREVTCEDDNANFANYMSNSTNDEIVAMRQYVLDHPNYIVYGEWLGGVDGMKFTGSLKGYTEGGFIVFAVFDIESGRYLRYDEWHDDIAAIYHLVVPRIAILTDPTIDDVVALLDKTDYLRPEGNPGEGIVLYNYDFYDKWNHFAGIVKLVREDFLNSKSRKSKAREAKAAGETEREFVEEFCTVSEISKAQAKVMVAMGVDEWTNDKALIGRTMNEVVTSVIEDNLVDFIFKKKMKVDMSFGNVRNLINQKVRDYLGL